MNEISNTTNTLAERLRAAARLVEEHPDLPPPMVTGYSSGAVDVDWFVNLDDNQLDTMRALRRGLGGTWEKRPSNVYFTLANERDGLNLKIVADRKVVCTPRTVGVETVTIPAVEAQPERVETRELIEWDCEPLNAEAGA